MTVIKQQKSALLVTLMLAVYKCYISQPIAMKCVTRIELGYIIDVARFGVDRSQNWGFVAVNYYGLLLLEHLHLDI